MKYFFFILFFLFNSNGIEKNNAKPVEELPTDKAFVIQGITLGVQMYLEGMDSYKGPGFIIRSGNYRSQSLTPGTTHICHSGPFISRKYKRRVHFRSHPDEKIA